MNALTFNDSVACLMSMSISGVRDLMAPVHLDLKASPPVSHVQSREP